MSTNLTLQTRSVAPRPILSSPAAVARPPQGWLFGPWFDLLFLANLAWPLVVVASLQGAPWLTGSLSFMQLYFISSPHRWITLVMVFCDRDRFWKEPVKFGGLALGLVGLGLVLVGVGSMLPQATNSLMLLMMLDYVWNSWHFAAQHAGIARIYGRLASRQQSLSAVRFERTTIRTLVIWAFIRVAVHVAGRGPYADNVQLLTPWLPWLDPVVVVPALLLLVREWKSFSPEARGRALYISSVVFLYTAQLVAIRLDAEAWMRGLFLAGAIFHAVEYLAVCSWAVRKKTAGIWRYQIARTGLAVLVFMIVLGIANASIAAQSGYAWALITLLVSLLHYGYDGIIWKSRPPAKKS